MTAGPVEAQFRAAVTRFAGPARAVATGLVGTFGVVATPTGALPLAFGLLALTLVAGAADVFAGRGTAFVLSALRAGAVCACQPWTANLWAINVLTITAITWQWEYPPRLTVPVLAGLLALAGLDEWFLVALRVAVESVLARLAFVLLVRSTARTDTLRAERAALERAETLARDRRRREREYLALLHDTASATFLTVAAGATADPAAVAGYAARDLAILTGQEDAPAELEAGLRAVVADRRSTVDAHWEQVPLIPAAAALALVRAADEAVRNAERHSGAARVALHLAPARAGVMVTISDTGAGFDPTRIPASRRGVRVSLVERMRDAGGTAEIRSSPGAGTTVTLRWPDA
ncbi:ATP-binding protein [Amycolatopsis sp. NBC_00355]|uniref:sensor histidine kinase n=1 Tax=Amycolatopsis sp. NBC_00355 TaxID=2975957 RepID=UPI002E2687DF